MPPEPKPMARQTQAEAFDGTSTIEAAKSISAASVRFIPLSPFFEFHSWRVKRLLLIRATLLRWSQGQQEIGAQACSPAPELAFP
jgi:hypothetical protein